MTAMQTDNDHTGESADQEALFCATLTPHRSLGSRGFLILMAGVVAVSFIGGIVFVVIGAWPVFGFFGLDVVLLFFAFRANYRAANAYEVVTVTPSELTVRKVDARGRAREWLLNPMWVRLHQDVHPDFGVLGLALVSRGRQLPIATFLGADERQSFAQALGAALMQARRGG
jgi:uncharacterized membrane protein